MSLLSESGTIRRFGQSHLDGCGLFLQVLLCYLGRRSSLDFLWCSTLRSESLHSFLCGWGSVTLLSSIFGLGLVLALSLSNLTVDLGDLLVNFLNFLGNITTFLSGILTTFFSNNLIFFKTGIGLHKIMAILVELISGIDAAFHNRSEVDGGDTVSEE